MDINGYVMDGFTSGGGVIIVDGYNMRRLRGSVCGARYEGRQNLYAKSSRIHESAKSDTDRKRRIE